MDVRDKLDVLARDAQYDLACACGTKQGKDHRKRDASGSKWLYPVTVAGGGSGILFKTLMTNVCSNDCKYCPLRAQQDPLRVSVTPDEMAKFFMEVRRKQWLLGIFLSSGVTGRPDTAMQHLIDTAEILRNTYHYKGYIHLKIIPGASLGAIDRALELSTAVSLNIEAPGANHIANLSDSKNFNTDIVAPLKYISEQTSYGSRHQKVRTSSQFIVGASDESDKEILDYTWAMYRKLNFGRLYYSAYQGGLGDPTIPGEQLSQQSAPLQPLLFDSLQGKGSPDILTREHRLYQADFLFRLYGFDNKEMFFNQQGNLDLVRDPKQVWADNHPECFPVSVKKADSRQLLRVPGIGPTFAQKIVEFRKYGIIHTLDDLPIGDSVLKKARQYLTI